MNRACQNKDLKSLSLTRNGDLAQPDRHWDENTKVLV